MGVKPRGTIFRYKNISHLWVRAIPCRSADIVFSGSADSSMKKSVRITYKEKQKWFSHKPYTLQMISSSHPVSSFSDYILFHRPLLGSSSASSSSLHLLRLISNLIQLTCLTNSNFYTPLLAWFPVSLFQL